MSEHGEVRGCVFPKELYYDVEDHTWVRLNDDGTVTIGMTDVAQSLAGPILHARVKKIGTQRARGKPIGTVESAKWVGPVKSPLSGEIVEINETVGSDPQVINRSPYKAGWIVKMKPSDLDNELALMVTGDEAVRKYQEKMDKDGIKECKHVDDFEV